MPWPRGARPGKRSSASGSTLATSTHTPRRAAAGEGEDLLPRVEVAAHIACALDDKREWRRGELRRSLVVLYERGLAVKCGGCWSESRAVWWGAALISLLPPRGGTRRMGNRLWGARPKGAVRRPDEKRRLGGPPSWQPDASPS